MAIFRTVISKTGDIAEYAVYLFFRFLLGILPVKLLMNKGDVIGKWLYYILRIRRDVVIANLRYAFGDSYKGIPVKVYARSVYTHIFKVFLDLLFIQKNMAHMKEYVQIKNIERFKQALQAKKGAILVTGHFGNFELGGLALAWSGIPITLIVKPIRNPYIDREITRLRQSLGAEIISSDRAGKGIISALRRNRVVCLLSDQDVGLFRGTLVQFFGHPASTPTGPARIALKTRTPLIPSFIFRQKNGTHILEVCNPIEMEYSKSVREREIKRITQEISLTLERWIRLYPEQYFWLHRRWKSTQDGRLLYLKNADTHAGNTNISGNREPG